ncbi:CPBP family intramembrane glutamic endopeptidase [Vibrio tubiashii]|uniref:Amino terminal protease family protein n=1 Tax=Vibrio tubiashii ATCC 19109 TaxID=1051646 RepID=F9T4E9_9VIBR|nr:CPBP family intramembrane glutamic endopeptidase [Vibrio tubiashii]AIW13325.1 peptidase [Vibrio tubiashii ATCC 19109]EGU56060.1 putative amino terminal protease family protein [Vibrio tubiashii ATCC 19109]EIF04461.1 putative amino terminal protease family protein [Vibrio tubiashii NCIMB 1337 = ATCC 19106]
MNIYGRQENTLLMFALVCAISVFVFPALIGFIAFVCLYVCFVANYWRLEWFQASNELRKACLSLVPLGFSGWVLWSPDPSPLWATGWVQCGVTTVVFVLVLAWQAFQCRALLKTPVLTQMIFAECDLRERWTYVSFILLCAIGEELLFRGVLYRLLSHHWGAFLLLSSLMFYFWHALMPWARRTYQRCDYVKQAMLALSSSSLLVMTDSIYPSLALHLAYNLGVCLPFFIYIYSRNTHYADSISGS